MMNTTTQPGPLEVRLSDELGAVSVLGLSACDNTAEQARARSGLWLATPLRAAKKGLAATGTKPS